MTKKIMIVDDDPSIQSAVRAVLQYAGYEIRSAKGGKECIEMLQKESPPDLILLDIMMEDVSGETVFQYITQSKPDIRVIFMSAVQPSEQSMKVMQAKGWKINHLTKPFTMETLRTVVRKVLEE